MDTKTNLDRITDILTIINEDLLTCYKQSNEFKSDNTSSLNGHRILFTL